MRRTPAQLIRSATKIAAGTGIALGLICALSGCGKTQRDTPFAALRQAPPLTVETADLVISGYGEDCEPLLLDRHTIYQLPGTSFCTHDPWENRTVEYTGVSLIDLLHAVGLPDGATAVWVKAWNGYEIPIRISDLRRYQYLLAFKMDEEVLGETEATKNKGRFMIAINFDGPRQIDVEIYKNQLVWQVRELSLTADGEL